MPRLLHSRPNAAMARGWARNSRGPAPRRQQFVQVVRGGRPGAGLDPLGEVGVVQQPEVRVVDQLVFLAFPQRLDGQPELLLDLVHRVVVQVRDPGVHPQHGLGHAQLVLARARARSRRRCRAARSRRSCPAVISMSASPLAVRRLARVRSPIRRELRPAAPVSCSADPCERARGRTSMVHGRRRRDRVCSQRRLLGPRARRPEVAAVGDDAEHVLLAVSARRRPAPPGRARPGRARPPARPVGDHLAGLDLPLREPGRRAPRSAASSAKPRSSGIRAGSAARRGRRRRSGRSRPARRRPHSVSRRLTR